MIMLIPAVILRKELRTYQGVVVFAGYRSGWFFDADVLIIWLASELLA